MNKELKISPSWFDLLILVSFILYIAYLLAQAHGIRWYGVLIVLLIIYLVVTFGIIIVRVDGTRVLVTMPLRFWSKTRERHVLLDDIEGIYFREGG